MQDAEPKEEADLPVAAASPVLQEESSPLPENDKIAGNVIKLPWAQFKTLPLAADLAAPYPAYQEISDATSEQMSDWLQKHGWSTLGKLCEQTHKQQEIAQQFIQWAAPLETGGGLLLQNEGADEHYWFVGDVHGYLSALLKCMAFVSEYRENHGGTHTLILLGDILDRGPKSFATLALLQYCKLHEAEMPFRLIGLKGNHDIGLYQTADGRFASRVTPSESAEYLNEQAAQSAEWAKVLGTAAIEWARIAPCMGEITGLGGEYASHSILFTHGGLPHTDIQKKLYELHDAHEQQPQADFLSLVPEALRAECCKDFTWVRLVEDLPFKIPNRGNSGCQMGTEDVNTYRRIHSLLTGRAVSFVVRGHDHEKKGYRLYSADESRDVATQRRKQKHCGVLTINAMEPSNADGPLFLDRNPTLTHWSVGRPMQLHILPAAVANVNV